MYVMSKLNLNTYGLSICSIMHMYDVSKLITNMYVVSMLIVNMYVVIVNMYVVNIWIVNMHAWYWYSPKKNK